MYSYYKLELLTKSMNMHCKFSREQIQDQGLWIHLGLDDAVSLGCSSF